MGKVDATHDVLRRAALALFLLVALVAVAGQVTAWLQGTSLSGGFKQSLAIVSGLNEDKLSSGVALDALFVLLAFAGDVVVFYLFYLLVDYLISGKIYEALHGVQTMANFKRMKDHYIITGAGRVGLSVAWKLKKEGKKFVVIDKNQEPYDQAVKAGYPAILGDCTHHDVLKSANVREAQCVITVLGDDPDNVFVTLAVKQLAPRVCVISRAEREETIEKLKQAGATDVFMPSAISGQAMAQAALEVKK